MDNFWEKPDWESEDRHLKKIAQMPFSRPFPFIPKAEGLYIIRGPRQVGKSSWLKTILSHYTAPKTHKSACYYLSCENVTDYHELAEILKSVRTRKVVLLDEVSFVKDWDRAVKHEMDAGFKNILIVTGSHAHDLKHGADRMPGRFDGGGEYSLLPMDFFEFAQMRKQAKWPQLGFSEECELYFKVGGFPGALAEAGAEGRKPKKTMEMYWNWLVGDFSKLGKQEAYLEELIIQLAVTLQTPVSFQTLAKKTRIGSHNTVQDYVSVLESCFAVKQLLAVDQDTGGFRFKKDRKFYFSDPLLYWIALDRSGRLKAEKFEEKMAEQVAHEFLSRRYRRFGYLSNPKGEVDFVLPSKWAIEVKWSDFAQNLSKAYLQLKIPGKSVWTKANFMSELPESDRE